MDRGLASPRSDSYRDADNQKDRRADEEDQATSTRNSSPLLGYSSREAVPHNEGQQRHKTERDSDSEGSREVGHLSTVAGTGEKVVGDQNRARGRARFPFLVVAITSLLGNKW